MSVPRRLLVLYGSQEGCAESVAQRIAGDATGKHGWDVELLSCNSFKKTKGGSLLEEKMCVIVTSTTGNGDPPDNCDRFWRYLKRRSHASDMLCNLNFSVLGLGDTNYDKFCHIAKGCDRRIGELGGHRFFPLGCADDGTGLGDVIEPWISGFFPALEKVYESLTLLSLSSSLPASSGATTDVNNNAVAASASATSAPTRTPFSPTSTTPHSPPSPPTLASSSSMPSSSSPNQDDVSPASPASPASSPCSNYALPLPITTPSSSTTSSTEARLVVLYGRKDSKDKEIAEGLSAAAAAKYGWTTAVLPCSKYRRTGRKIFFI